MFARMFERLSAVSTNCWKVDEVCVSFVASSKSNVPDLYSGMNYF